MLQYWLQHWYGKQAFFSSWSWFVRLNVGPSRVPIQFKIDTGSAVVVLPLKHFRALNLKTPLEEPDSRLTSYSGNTLQVKGMVKLTLRYKDKITEQMCYIVDGNASPLLSLQASIDLGLITLTYALDNYLRNAPLDKESVLKEYSDLFQWVVTIPGVCKLHIKPDAIPVINPPRRVPEALKDKLHNELQRLELDGIIAKVTEPTDWVNSIVVVEKPKTGNLRICLDPKALNDAIRRPHYPMPTLEDVTSKLTDAK